MASWWNDKCMKKQVLWNTVLVKQQVDEKQSTKLQVDKTSGWWNSVAPFRLGYFNLISFQKWNKCLKNENVLQKLSFLISLGFKPWT